MKYLVISIFCLTLSTNSFAAKSKYTFENITMTMGNWFENFKEVQTSSSGNTDNYEIAPYISLSSDYKLNVKYALIPELGWVITRDAGDSRIQKNLFFTKLDMAYYVTKKFRLRAGTSLMILNIKGQGGEKSLSNGDGQDTYFIPSESRTALNQTLDFAAEFLIEKISIRAGAYIYAFIDSNERMITYSTSVSYLYPIGGSK